MSDITNSESSQFSEKAYVNKKLLLCYQIISAVLFIAQRGPQQYMEQED